MRSIDSTLSAAQDTLGGRPAFSLVVGTSPDTIDLTSRLVAYHYDEHGEVPGQPCVVLDNSDGALSTLSGSYAYIKHGARVELKRGLTLSGTDYLAELPATWIEALDYRYARGRSLLILTCIDAWGKLQRHRIASDQSWSSTSATTILEWILAQAGLTRASGSMTSMSIRFKITPYETLLGALQRLMRIMPEYFYYGLDGEIKWKELDPSESNDYTFGWNAHHPLVGFARSKDGAAQHNTVIVAGAGSYTGSATDSAEVANVGTRRLTLYDVSLQSNAQCAAAATAILRYYTTRKQEHVLYCKPCHGLELYDVVTVVAPPWGGSNIVGRPISIAEDYDAIRGAYVQTITLGYPQVYRPYPDYRRIPGPIPGDPPVIGPTWDGSQILNIDPAALMPCAAHALTGHTGHLTVDGRLEVVGEPAQISAGNGEVILDEDGIGIDAAAGVYVPENDPMHAVHWIDDGTGETVGYIYAETDAHESDPRGVINLYPRDGASEDGYVYVLSDLKVAMDVRFLEQLVSVKGGADYEVYALHPLTSPLTSTSYDGDAFSDTAKTKIDLSAVFGAPAGIAAGSFALAVRDSGAAANDTYLILSPNDTADSGPACSPPVCDDRWGRGSATVPCDSGGDVYLQIAASGANTFDAYVELWGYYL
ncbi:MAG: hypothetical protein JXA09_03955 [Anaerolineae bacterium]|nr:hypothetical protein [Anaerolineae bacterium]